MIFGEKLKAARKQAGLTQRELAELIGCKHNSVSDWEKGKVKPYVDTIEYICGALGVDPDYFFDESDDVPVRPIIPTFMSKYESLDEHGKAVVDAVLQLEVKRMEDLNGKE